jgi:sarcosine oxidase subunit delta
MLLINCPNCGPRNHSDLHFVGDTIARPDPNVCSPAEWRTYLYLRDNPAGWIEETWYCRAGCRTYFGIERNRLTNELREPVLPDRKLPGPAAETDR